MEATIEELLFNIGKFEHFCEEWKVTPKGEIKRSSLDEKYESLVDNWYEIDEAKDEILFSSDGDSFEQKYKLIKGACDRAFIKLDESTVFYYTMLYELNEPIPRQNLLLQRASKTKSRAKPKLCSERRTIESKFSVEHKSISSSDQTNQKSSITSDSEEFSAKSINKNSSICPAMYASKALVNKPSSRQMQTSKPLSASSIQKFPFRTSTNGQMYFKFSLLKSPSSSSSPNHRRRLILYGIFFINGLSSWWPIKRNLVMELLHRTFDIGISDKN